MGVWGGRKMRGCVLGDGCGCERVRGGWGWGGGGVVWG